MRTVDLRSSCPILLPRVAKHTAVWSTKRQKQRGEPELTVPEIHPLDGSYEVSLNNHTVEFDP